MDVDPGAVVAAAAPVAAGGAEVLEVAAVPAPGPPPLGVPAQALGAVEGGVDADVSQWRTSSLRIWRRCI